MSINMNLEPGKFAFRLLSIVFTFALKGMTSWFTSCEQLPVELWAKMLGMQPIRPNPAMANFLAPRLYSLCIKYGMKI